MRTQPEFDPVPISNRRRWLLLFLPAIISLFGIVVLFVFQQQTTPSWQVRMEAHQAEQADRGNVFEVMAVVTALLPEEFGANEPFRPVGDPSFVFTAPKEVRCLEVRPTGSDERRILLLIRYIEDAEPNDWVIYEAAGTESRINRSIAELGCFFPSFEEQ